MDKYKKFILDIIINRGRFGIPDGEYKEQHHIIPKCMGGSDDEENLVDLLLREHVIAHKLLADIYPGCDDVQYAFWMMCNCREYDDVVTPVEYEAARKIFSENHPMKNPEVAAKAGKTLKEYYENNPEARETISKALKEYYENNPEARETKSKALKEYYENNPEARETKSKALKEYYENNPEARETQSKTLKEYYENNPEAREAISKALSKPVEAIDPKTGERVYYFESTHDAGRAGFDFSHVCACCNGKYGYKTHHGYIWRWIQEVSDDDSDN